MTSHAPERADGDRGGEAVEEVPPAEVFNCQRRFAFVRITSAMRSCSPVSSWLPCTLLARFAGAWWQWSRFAGGVFADHQAVDSPALLTLGNSCEDFVDRAASRNGAAGRSSIGCRRTCLRFGYGALTCGCCSSPAPSRVDNSKKHALGKSVRELHWVRDVTYEEDKSLVRNWERVSCMATLRCAWTATRT